MTIKQTVFCIVVSLVALSWTINGQVAKEESLGICLKMDRGSGKFHVVSIATNNLETQISVIVKPKFRTVDNFKRISCDIRERYSKLTGPLRLIFFRDKENWKNWGPQNNFTSGAFPAGFSVSDFYTKTHGKTTGVRPNVYTSYFLSQTRLTVFFNPNTSISSPALLFHEALHGYGAYINRGKPGKYSDENLMNIFGKLQGGSEKITEHIEKYCGSYFNIF